MEWRDIRGYEGFYKISDTGVVKSLERFVPWNNSERLIKEKDLVPQKNNDGYLNVKLCKDGKYRTFKIHRLVAEAFLDKPNDFDLVAYEVNHIDCDRTNNYYKNLEWVTHKDNISYSILKGNHFCTKNIMGSNNPNYRNRKLAILYKENPELSKTLSRPEKQNGRAKKVTLMDSQNKVIKTFEWIGECAKYLVDHGVTRASINSIRYYISKSAMTGKSYLGYKFKF